MTNPKNEKSISPIEAAIIMVTIGVGGQVVLAPRKMIADAGQSAWISILLGALVFGGAALLMVRLGEEFAEESFVEYIPNLWGKWGGFAVIWWYNVVFAAQFSLVLKGVGQVIALYMFDRTPVEILWIAMIIVITYCCLQDMETVLRFQQFLFFTTYPFLTIVWSFSFLNFLPDNLLPVWSGKVSGVLMSTILSWNMYSGYEVILLLFPLVYRKNMNLKKTTVVAFAIMTFIFLLVVILVIGVLTVKTAQNTHYPTIAVIRNVEFPGTFVERLENYLLLAWIPIVFDTLVMFIYVPAQACKQYYKHKDHRPWVLILIPVGYIVLQLISSEKTADFLGNIITIMGVGLSFGIVPVSYIMARMRRKC